MVTIEQLLAEVNQLKDPEFGLGLAELRFIRDVVIKEDRVSATVLLSKEDESYKEKVRRKVTEVCKTVGAEEVHLRLRALTDFERNEAARTVQEFGKIDQKPSVEESQNTVNVLDPQSNVKFIAIASGKGGVGKSTVTVNLAVALARMGKKVGLVDADIYGFSVPDMMGIEERPRVEQNRILPPEKFGVKVISMGFFVEDNTPVIWRGPMLGKMLRQFFNDIDWGKLDYILLDLPPGTGDVALDVHQLIPQSKEIIVTTPHATAAFVAARAGAMAVQTNHDIIGVVENMSYYSCSQCGKKDYIFGKGGGAKLAEELHTKLLGQIPLGVPENHVAEPDYSPSVYKENTQIGQIYFDLAKQVLTQLEQ